MNIEKGKLLFDESYNPILRSKLHKFRIYLLLGGIIFLGLMIFINWLAIIRFDSNPIFIFTYLAGNLVFLIIILSLIRGFFATTFMKIYENGISLPTKSIKYTFKEEEFVPFTEIELIKIEQRMLSRRKLIMQGKGKRLRYFGDVKEDIIDFHKFIQILNKLKEEGKINFKETKDKPFYP